MQTNMKNISLFMDKLNESERKKYYDLTKIFLNKMLKTFEGECDINEYEDIMGIINDHFHDFAIEYLEEKEKLSVFKEKYQIFIDNLHDINMTRECKKYFDFIIENNMYFNYNWESIFLEVKKYVSIINKSLFIKILNTYIIE